MGRTVTVRTPATSANLGPGFDALGLALDLYADVTLALHSGAAAQATSRAAGMALAAANTVFAQVGQQRPPRLQASYRGEIPVGRGLGASAVVRVGALVAANRLLDEPFSIEQLGALAAELEGHADNAAAALFGGFQVAVWHEGTLTHIGLPAPSDLAAVVLVPEMEMPTQESRQALPAELTLPEAVFNIGRAALLVAAFAQRRFDALAVATQDVLHQPARGRIFGALYEVIDAARAAGAHSAHLSGAGSSVLALTSTNAPAVGAAMLAAARARGFDGQIITTRLSNEGARVITDERLP
jgi:homoserine kinase